MAHPVVTAPEQLAAASAALKRLALNAQCRRAFLDSGWFQDLLMPAARRYLLAGSRAELWPRLRTLHAKGYRVGVEYVGEEVRDPAEVERMVGEYLQLLDEMPAQKVHPRIGFDLSAVGLLVSPQLAADNTERLLRAAAGRGVDIVLSMERSTLVGAILEVFHRLAPQHRGLGITLQAHLHRTERDLDAVLRTGCAIRLVKGVYNEPAEAALPRGDALDERYIALLRRILAAGVPVTCASHDEALLQRLQALGLLQPQVEVEMLHGVRPRALRALQESGVPCRIAAVYGSNWLLHVVHRIAEFPPNLFQALADLDDPARVVFAQEY